MLPACYFRQRTYMTQGLILIAFIREHIWFKALLIPLKRPCALYVL